MRSDQEIKQLINLYILSALEEDEKGEVEEYLKQPEYMRYYKETEFILAETSYSIDDYKLPDNLKMEIMAKIESPGSGNNNDFTDGSNGNDNNNEKNVRRLSFMPRISYALAASIIAILFINTLYMNAKLNEQNRILTEFQNEHKHDLQFMKFINNPNVFSVELSGIQNSNAHGELAWNKESNDAFLFVENLEMPEKKDVYQFWIAKKDGTVSEAMGTFKVNEDGTYMLFVGCMPEPSKVKGIFITMEPDGGMPEPTGTKYLSGSL